jgi:hypothetical protein
MRASEKAHRPCYQLDSAVSIVKEHSSGSANNLTILHLEANAQGLPPERCPGLSHLVPTLTGTFLAIVFL